MRIAGALWMLAFLLWLPVEDTQIGMTAVLAATGAGWLAFRLQPWHSVSLWQAAFRGGILGAVFPFMAITLMAFKSGLHGHGFPDFTASQAWLALVALPWSVAIGFFLAPAAKYFALGCRSGRDKK